MNEVAATQSRVPAASTVEDVLARGDLSKLTHEQRIEWLRETCGSLGLNPLTQPIVFMTLQGKTVPYVRKDGTDQLRKINGISIQMTGHEVTDGLLTVRVRATDKTGRSDEDYGVVSVAGLRGEAASNAFMKAVTKAKRRVTLSISGLGFLDESDIEERSPIYGGAAHETKTREPLRLDPSMTQAQRTELVGQEGDPGAAAVGQHDAAEDAAERVPDRAFASEVERANTAPFVVPRPDDSDASWATWWQTLMAYVKAQPDVEGINAWTTVNAENIAALANLDKAKHSTLISQIKREIANRNAQGT